jgi:hypothetical protein
MRNAVENIRRYENLNSRMLTPLGKAPEHDIYR